MTAWEKEEIVLPAIEKLQYRCIELPNGLKAVLVHDAEADKAAASLDVHVGSMLDPDEFPGLAHFTEHMLFYSSEKYPEEDAYSKFVEDHGGRTNAWTAAENTNYHFDVNWDNLEPTLDRFAQFFICPKISSDGVEREINAVDSEHSKNIDSDAWRLMQLHKHTANPDHPWSRFATGNLKTLGEEPKEKGLDVREAVVEFHSKWYSANIMRLAVISRHSLDELEAMVRAGFTPIKNMGLDVPRMPSDVFLSEHTGKLMCVVPVRETNALEFAWQVPPSTPLYKASPLNYLSHLLGHEGTGSLFALLKELGWVSSLVAGESGLSISSASFFYARMELTEEGLLHAPEVGTLLFKYLNLLKGESGVNEEEFKEMQALQRLRFEFRDKQSPYSASTSLSSALQLYPPSDLLLAIYHVPLEYKPEVIRDALDMITPSTCRVTWTSKKFKEDDSAFKVDMAEPWYGTQYSLQDIPENWMAEWLGDSTDSRLHLPTPNPFVPTDFSLHTDEATDMDEPPVLAVNVPGRMEIYHKCDLTFSMPKAYMMFNFICPEAYASPDNVVMTRLYVKLLEDYLNEMAYPAELAGLSYTIHNNQSGFQMSIGGYNHKLLTLMDAVLHKMMHFEMKEERFTVIRETVAKEYSNVKFQQPYQWAMYRSEVLFQLRRWPVDDYIEAVKDITPSDVMAFVKKTFRRCLVRGLVVGNMPRAEVETLSEHIMQQMTEVMSTKAITPAQAEDPRTIKAPQGATTLVTEPGPNPSNDNSAIVAVYQVGPDELRRNALTQLLVHLAKRDAFHQLRTQQQLGYIVALFTNHDLCTYSLQLVIQSNAFSAATLSERIDMFIQNFIDEGLAQKCKDPDPNGAKTDAGGTAAADGIAGGAEAGEAEVANKQPYSEFTKAIQELTKSKLEKPKTLWEISRRLWNEVANNTLVFNRQEAEVAELSTVTPEELLQFAASVLQPESRRKVIVAVRGSAENAATEPSLDSTPSTTTTISTTPATASSADRAPPAAADSAKVNAKEEEAGEGDAAGEKAKVPPSKQTKDFSRGGKEKLCVVEDLPLFKRTCELWPNVAASYQAQRLEHSL